MQSRAVTQKAAGACELPCIAGYGQDRNRAEPAASRQVHLPPAAIGCGHLCGVAGLPSMPITLSDSFSGERHKLTKTQIRISCKKQPFCNTIG